MISYLKGLIIEKYSNSILIEINNIGYEIIMLLDYSNYEIKIGQEIIIFTHCIIQKDHQSIFGFMKQKEQIIFREIIKINGLGPKVASTILSNISIQNLIDIIRNQDIQSLMNISNIGKKTAEKLLLVMKNNFTHIFNDEQKINTNDKKKNNVIDPKNEVIKTLITLGYKKQTINNVIKKINYTGTDQEQWIREALKIIL